MARWCCVDGGGGMAMLLGEDWRSDVDERHDGREVVPPCMRASIAVEEVNLLVFVVSV